jgi:hypothetical protein
MPFISPEERVRARAGALRTVACAVAVTAALFVGTTPAVAATTPIAAGQGTARSDGTSLSTRSPAAASRTCTYPADVLDLRNWYEGLPVGNPNDPTVVKQPQLATYTLAPWFVPTAGCSGVQFRAAVNGVTTSGSSYPRSELREMSGSATASWSSTSGTSTMVVRQAITHLPAGKPQVVAGQIHGSSDDVSVFRLEGANLYVTNGDDSHYKLVTSSYTLGTVFETKFVVSGGVIRAYYNGALVATITQSFSGGYFKAGAYTQANCAKSSPCSDSNYGEVVISGLTVTHT